MVATHVKNMLVKLDHSYHSPRDPGENTKSLKVPPRYKVNIPYIDPIGINFSIGKMMGISLKISPLGWVDICWGYMFILYTSPSKLQFAHSLQVNCWKGVGSPDSMDKLSATSCFGDHVTLGWLVL